ncbi:MAG: 16S rRNA (cytosine(1402)-N(4))-methyltransferase RsmH [Clostridiales Family XIII bacterium]|jgi:16S rRNA (cytosine1402-N4)-methyltransferase|nr:16S rRNA (cytosine(1402)-N(4))-methyltransferase RsmH [Clostridiales Family XIII bacterium]
MAAAKGAEFSHEAVMPRELVGALAELGRPKGVFVDGTLGGGGHGAGVCSFLEGDGLFVGIDRDAEALAAAGRALQGFPCGKRLVHGNFRDIKAILEELGIDGIDGAALDLGVSSFQLDNAGRGFSYMADAPLDMRMDAEGDGLTAEDVVNGYSRDELTRVIRAYGEERWASRISAFIENRRKSGPIRTTGELADLIKAAIPSSARREGPHPAKRTFQAIRIEVNDELGALSEALEGFIGSLRPGGRLCVISFHSLEDRIVKEAFMAHENPCQCPPGLPQCACGRKPDGKRLTRKPVLPSAEETEANPRARSAKLRVFEKLGG